MKNLRRCSKFLIGSLVSLLILAGCDGGSSLPSADPIPAIENTSTSVVPSLGMVRNAVVRITNVSGTPILGASGELTDTGSISLTYLSNTPGPLIVEVLGDDDAEYFDESTGTFVPFPTGSKIRTVLPQPQAIVGVTALTEVAAARFQATGGTSKQDAINANEEVRMQFLPGITDITAPPTVIGAATDKVGNDQAGLYAAYLGSLANLGSGRAAPALAVTAQLAEDFSDGVFDTAVDGTTLTTPVFNNNDAGFASQFDAALAMAVTRFGRTELSTNDFANVIGSLVPGSGGGNSGGGGTDGGTDGGSGGIGMCINNTTPTAATLPDLVASQIINFEVSFISTGAMPGFALADVLEFTFSSSGALFQDNVLFSDSPFSCGGTEIFWQNTSQDRVLSLSFVSDTEINELNFNTVSGTFLAQATPASTSGGTDGGNGGGTDGGGTDGGNGGGTDGGGTGGGNVGGAPLQFFGAGFDPVLPATAPTTVTPPAAVDVRPQIPGLFEQLVAQLRTRSVQRITGENGAIEFYSQREGKFTYQVLNDIGYPIGQIYYKTGPDGEPLTADDIVTGYESTDTDASGFIATGRYEVDHPGVDGVWFTADDNVSRGSGVVAEVVNDGNYVLALGAVSSTQVQGQNFNAGSDGILFTTDDSISQSVGFIVAVIDGNNNRGQVVNFRDGTLDENATISAYSLANFDGNQNAVQTVTYTGDGADNQWFTADDQIGLITLGVVNAAQNRLDYLYTYDGAGVDGNFFTADDEIASITAFDYNESGQQRFVATHTDIGADGIWFTADDTGSAIAYNYDTQDNIEFFTTSTSYGSDAVWFTSDDSINYYQIRQRDAAGNLLLTGNSSNPGEDGLVLTADDVFNSARRQIYDANNSLDLTIYYNNSVGADGISLTADDVSSYTDVLLDSEGKVIASVFSQPGPDGIAFTADDTGFVFTELASSDAGVVKTLRLESPGVDGIWFTADDVAASLQVTTAGEGSAFVSATFNDAGPDGVFDTADDIQTSSRRAVDTGDNSLTITTYSDPGADDVWGNEDDVISGYSVDMYDSTNMLLMMSVYYSDAGADGIFVTNDDLPESYAIFEYDSNGFRTLEYYPPISLTGFGIDGIPFNGDDYTNPYERTTYDAMGQIIRQDRYGSAGADGLYLTADDVITSAQFFNLNPSEREPTFANTGFMGEMCPVDQSNAGSIVVTVKNETGMPVAGVTVQVDASGASQQTSAEGVVTLTGLTGSHDVHIFSDNHSWQSFICLAPNGELSLPVTLSEKIANPNGGRRLNAVTDGTIPLVAGNQRTGENFVDLVVYALIDDNGKVLGTNIPNSVPSITGIPRVRPLLVFTDAQSGISLTGISPGTEVTGEIWAYRYADKLRNSQSMLEAVKVLESATYTAFGSNAGPELEAARLDLTPVFSQVAATALPELYFSLNEAVFRLSNGLPSTTSFLNFNDGVPAGGIGHYLRSPEGLPMELGFVDSISTESQSNSTVTTVTAVPASGLTNDFADRVNRVALSPRTFSQGAGDSTATDYRWHALRQTTDQTWFVAQTVVFASSEFNFNWMFHLPAGESMVTFPSVPETITNNVFSNSGFFRVAINAFTGDGVAYQTTISETDIFAIPVGVDYEEATTTGGSFRP